jgi:hypothetical protein
MSLVPFASFILLILSAKQKTMRGKTHGLPRFLRRHYPHQVQGVRSTFVVDHLSQAAPPH